MKLLVVPFLALVLAACAKSGDAPVAAKATPVDAVAEIGKLVQPCIGLSWTCADQNIGADHTTIYSAAHNDYALLYTRLDTKFIIVMRNADAVAMRWSTNLEDYH
jgi:hypothetical protein